MSRKSSPELSGPDSRQSVKIWIVSDNPSNIHVSASFLCGFGFEVALVRNAHDSLRDLTVAQPDLILLDSHFGQSIGLEMLRAIRSYSKSPVIVVTGGKGVDVDCALYLELGADDCLAGADLQRELVSRIRAVLRPALIVGPAQNVRCQLCRFGGWGLKRNPRILTNPSGARVHLTNSDFALLVAFLDAPQQVLSREYLLQATHMHEDMFDRAIDIKVLRLRRKLEQDPSAPRIIETRRGVGYVFTLPVERLG